MPHQQTSIWIKDDTLTIAVAEIPLAEHEVQYNAQLPQVVDVGEVRLFHTPHASCQRTLWSPADLAEISWYPARKIDPLPPHRRRRGLLPSPLWDTQVLATLRKTEDGPDEQRRKWRYPLPHRATEEEG